MERTLLLDHLTFKLQRELPSGSTSVDSFVKLQSLFKKKKISVQLLSVLHGHSFFSSPPPRPMMSE